jgi:hypothetical protein
MARDHTGFPVEEVMMSVAWSEGTTAIAAA